MGSIKRRDGKLIVQFDISELIMEKAYFHPPGELPKEDGLVWYNMIGQIISRAAWRKVHETKPSLLTEGYDMVAVEGDGTVTVTYYTEKSK